MVQTIGKNTNFNDAPVVLDSKNITSTPSDIVTLTKEDSLLIFTNLGNRDIFIRMYPATQDTTLRGFVIFKGTTTELVLDIVRTDVTVSALTANGNSALYLTIM